MVVFLGNLLLTLVTLGMNGVLAKPFTKEGMLKSVKTHMVHLLKNPPEDTDPSAASAFVMGGMPFLNPGSSLAPGQAIKLEGPGTPSAGGSTWSPNTMTHEVDSYGMVNGGNQYGMGSRPQYASAVGDNDSPPGKRQRNY